MAVLAVALVASACSGGDGDANDAAPVNSVSPTSSSTTTTEAPAETSTTTAPPATTSTTTTSTTTTTAAPELSDEEQIAELIEAFYVLLAAAIDPPDPGLEGWDSVATDRVVESVRSNVAGLLGAGTGVGQAEPGLPFVIAANTTLVNPDLAISRVCIRDDAFSYSIDTGEVLQELSIVVLRRFESMRTPSGWRINVNEQVQDFEDGEDQQCVESL